MGRACILRAIDQEMGELGIQEVRAGPRSTNMGRTKPWTMATRPPCYRGVDDMIEPMEFQSAEGPSGTLAPKHRFRHWYSHARPHIPARSRITALRPTVRAGSAIFHLIQDSPVAHPTSEPQPDCVGICRPAVDPCPNVAGRLVQCIRVIRVRWDASPAGRHDRRTLTDGSR